MVAELPKHGEHWIHYKNPNKVYKVLGVSIDPHQDHIDQMLIDCWCADPDDINTPIAVIDTLNGYVLYDGTTCLVDFVIYRGYPDTPMQNHSTWCRHKDNFMGSVDVDGESVPRFTKVC